jgi:hypothetical protein
MQIETDSWSVTSLAWEIAHEYRDYTRYYFTPRARRRSAAQGAARIASIVRQDCAGVYYPFALTCEAVSDNQHWITAFDSACATASCEVFPELSRRQHWRHPSDKSIGVIVVPAVFASGALNWRGVLRLPVSAVSGPSDVVLIPVNDQATETLITGPAALRIAAAALRGWFHSGPVASMSLWIAYESVSDCRRPEAADHRDHPQVVSHWLESLVDTSESERRDWGSVAFFPQQVFYGLWA